MPVAARGSAEGSSEQVVSFVRRLIERGRLRPGDRLPAERDLATKIGVSRPTVRAGLHSLAALGVVHSKHGSGTYIPDGPPALRTEPLSFLAALHGFTRDEMHEVRRILEVGAAGLAAERATPEQLATLAGEVAGMFASLAERQVFLVHDVNFHRGVAAASGNPIIAALVEMVSAMYYERRVQTVAHEHAAALREREGILGELHQHFVAIERAHGKLAGRVDPVCRRCVAAGLEVVCPREIGDDPDTCGAADRADRRFDEPGLSARCGIGREGAARDRALEVFECPG